MKFRKGEDGVILCQMSKAEVDKFGLLSLNKVEPKTMPYHAADGTFDVKINGFDVQIVVTTLKASDAFVAQVLANGIKLTVTKLKPIRRQDILRAVLKRFREVCPKYFKIGVDAAG